LSNNTPHLACQSSAKSDHVAIEEVALTLHEAMRNKITSKNLVAVLHSSAAVPMVHYFYRDFLLVDPYLLEGQGEEFILVRTGFL
jgi:hypothetical protein